MLNWLKKLFADIMAIFLKKEDEPHVTPVPIETPAKPEPINPELGAPLSGRIKVLIGNLRIRTLPSLAGEITGFAEKYKVYDYSAIEEADGYRWFKVGENEWLADDNEGSVTENADKENFHFPVKYIAITEYYSGAHLGVDFGWNSDRGFPSDQPILAAFSGTVVKVWNFNDAGLTIKIRFDDEEEKLSWYAQYKHLSGANVKEGQTVQRGEKIGNMGGSGGYAPHLHFDLLKCPLGHEYEQTGGQREMYSYNPLEYLFATKENVLSYDRSCTRGVKFK